jgi:hypothetical protein
MCRLLTQLRKTYLIDTKYSRIALLDQKGRTCEVFYLYSKRVANKEEPALYSTHSLRRQKQRPRLSIYSDVTLTLT